MGSFNKTTEGYDREQGNKDNGAAAESKTKVSCLFTHFRCTSWCAPDNSVSILTNTVTDGGFNSL